MITATAILTGLFFGGVFYIIFGFWQEKEYIINQMKCIKQQRERQAEMKQKQQEAEKLFNEKWKKFEVQSRWTKK